MFNCIRVSLTHPFHNIDGVGNGTGVLGMWNNIHWAVDGAWISTSEVAAVTLF